MNMGRILAVAVLLASGVYFAVASLESALPAGPTKAVVVELFTSEGCSSCPPADSLLTHLRQDMAGRNIEVIPLGFHVDYWNSLGWRDRFSSAEFSQRQQRYARALGVDGPYTPQMVVDGTIEFVGSNAGMAQRAITQESQEPASAEITISPKSENALAVQITGPASIDSASVMLALTEDNLATRVGAGENNGRELRHAAVVRELKQLGTIRGGSFKADVPLVLEKEWKRNDLRAVIFVQKGDTGKVLGGASVPLLAQAR